MEETTSKSKRWTLPVILLLCATNIVTLWLWLKSNDTVIVERVMTEKYREEKSDVQEELKTLQEEFTNLKATDSSMQKDIEEKKQRIEKLLKEAKKHKNDAKIISQLKKETQTLRAIMQSYIRTIDSLGVLNKTLTDEKNTVLNQLDKEREKQTELVKQKEELQTTISKGSILLCSNIKAHAVYFRKTGKKEVETGRASKAEKIKVSFMLGQNRIAKAGPKDVFIRIVTPNGQEMTKSYDASNRFSFGKSQGYFAGTETINYANSDMEVVVYGEGQSVLLPGSYHIEIVCDAVVIGASTLILD